MLESASTLLNFSKLLERWRKACNHLLIQLNFAVTCLAASFSHPPVFHCVGCCVGRPGGEPSSHQPHHSGSSWAAQPVPELQQRLLPTHLDKQRAETGHHSPAPLSLPTGEDSRDDFCLLRQVCSYTTSSRASISTQCLYQFRVYCTWCLQFRLLPSWQLYLVGERSAIETIIKY